MRHVRELVETILLALLIFLAVRTVVQNYRVEGASMEPALHNGEYLLVNKIVYARVNLEPLDRLLPFLDLGDRSTRHLFRAPHRGDIIVFLYPNDPRRTFIKRIIGVPGDMVEIRDGTVHVNGEPLAEPYGHGRDSSSSPRTTIPPGNYYVLGDNRPSSSDSRQGWLVPEKNIIGLAWFSYWPPGEAGMAPNFDVAAAEP